jgi:hypothetical protein
MVYFEKNLETLFFWMHTFIGILGMFLGYSILIYWAMGYLFMSMGSFKL